MKETLSKVSNFNKCAVSVGTSQRYPSIPLYITVNEPLKGHEKDLILDIEEELVFGGPSAS